jgi:undecaprenyl-diphosphatase
VGTDLAHTSRLKAFFIGGAQGIAVIPGVSRSGISITTGLLLGLDRESAAAFSFLLSIPLIFGAGLTKIKYIAHEIYDPVFWAGVTASAVSGYIAGFFLMTHVKKKSFAPFAIYRVLLAAVLAWWILSGHHG